MLAERFGPRVADLVRRGHQPGVRRRAATTTSSTANTWPTAWKHNPWARVVKLSDFTDNGVGLIHTPPGPKLHKLASKYRPLVPILRDMVTRPDTPLSDEVKQRICEQLDLAEVRFDAILGLPAGLVKRSVVALQFRSCRAAGSPGRSCRAGRARPGPARAPPASAPRRRPGSAPPDRARGRRPAPRPLGPHGRSPRTVHVRRSGRPRRPRAACRASSLPSTHDVRHLSLRSARIVRS